MSWKNVFTLLRIFQALAGKVLKIHVRNFMCHASMEIKLNERVNFIIGRNGSGKSALLTALTVGLGAKATTTNRGANMKGNFSLLLQNRFFTKFQ